MTMKEITTNRFDGAIHDEVNADIGTNRNGERVVRLDLTYEAGTSPVTYTLILSVDAAITLRNLLDGVFDAAGIDDGGSNDDDQGLRGADAYDLMRFAHAFAGLGDAVGEQVEDLLAGRYDEVNANAVDLIRERLSGMNRELDEAIEAYQDQAGGAGNDEEDACEARGTKD